MPQRVVQGFPHDGADGQLHAGRNVTQIVGAQGDVEARNPRGLHDRGQVVERVRWAQRCRAPGPEHGEHAAQLGRGLAADVLDVRQCVSPRDRLARPGRPAGDGRADGDQSEAVGDQVVQVTGDPQAFGLRRPFRCPRSQLLVVPPAEHSGLPQRPAQHEDGDPCSQEPQRPYHCRSTDADGRQREQERAEDSDRPEPYARAPPRTACVHRPTVDLRHLAGIGLGSDRPRAQKARTVRAQV